MDVQVIIRKATADDAAAVQAITHAAFEDYEKKLGEIGAGHVKALTETIGDIKEDIQKKSVLLGVVNGQPIGSIRFEVCGDIAYISRFGVLPNAQKSGIGGMLLDRVATLCRDQYLKAIALHTASRMYGQVRFYYGHGYFIHSTSAERGYIRALLVHELEMPDHEYDLSPIMHY
jgi:ribosomal protein S18 acetylase RimI-like enzyme